MVLWPPKKKKKALCGIGPATTFLLLVGACVCVCVCVCVYDMLGDVMLVLIIVRTECVT